MASVSLAEPRRRQKWTLNPRGNLWANDDNKFGHKLMEKMGWEKGKGLGANQNGIVTNIKIKQKDNQKGVGFDGHDDTWLSHQEDFQAVLAALNVEHGAKGEGLTEVEKKKSIEDISRKSKRRVHYQKFVKGKDSSNYSADDLGCILGTNSDKLNAAPPVTEESSKSEEDSNGKFQQAGASYQEYFASKMAALKAKGKFADVPTWTDESNNPRTMGLGAAGARSIDREIQRDSLLNPSYLKEAKEEEASNRESKKRLIDEDPVNFDIPEEHIDVEPVKKKKKKTKENATTQDEDTVVDEMAVKTKKKKKKNKTCDEEELSVEVSVTEEITKKKSKKNKHRDSAEESTNVLEEGEYKKKKAKKSKKEKLVFEENEAIQEDSGCDEKSVKVKKAKKSKKEKKHKEVINEDVVPDSPENVEDENCTEEISAPQRKKKEKKNNLELEGKVHEESILKKDYTEAPGFKGSNILAIPGYGNC